MDQLRAKLQRIARDKIIKSQRKPTINTVIKQKKKQIANIKNCKNNEKPRNENNKIFFPKIAPGHFGYNRPKEARLATRKEREETKKFLEELNELGKTKKYKFEDFLQQANDANTQIQKPKNK